MKSSNLLFSSLALVALLVAGPKTSGQTLSVTNGLKLWLKADAGIATNTAGGVTQWSDQSGNANDAVQGDEALTPKLIPGAQNGKPVVRFDGNDDYLEAAPSPSLDLAADISTFYVVKFDDYATYRAVWAQTAVNFPGPNDYYLLPGTGIPRAYRGNGSSSSLGSVDGTTAVRAGSFVALGYQMAGTTLTHYLNGQATGSGEITATLVNAGGPLKIGTREDLFTKMKGDIAEIVIFDRSLTTAERTSVVTYLQTKYGIVNQAPTISISSPANNTSVAAPAVVSFAATAADSDGVIAKVDFYANGGLVGTATAAPYKIQLRVETGGPVTLVARATDNKDATAFATNIITATSSAAPPLTATNGLQLWLKADAGVTKDAAGAVSAWKDQSGQANDALQPDPTLEPVLVTSLAANNKPVIRFDGADDYLDVASTASIAITGDITSFFVVRFDDYATYRAVWGKTAANLPRPTDYYLLPNTGVPRVFRGSEVGNLNQFADGAAVPVNTFAVLGFSQAETNMIHYFNGRASGSARWTVSPTDSGTPLKIGTREDFVTKMKGDIAELVIYNKALSDTERTSLAIYMGAKYGVPIVLASNTLPTINLTAPSAGLTVNAPTNITVSASAADSDGSIVRVDFYGNGGLVGSAAKAPYQAQFLVPMGGRVALKAVATDNLGGQTTSAEVAVTANASTPNPLPVTQGLQLWLRADAGVSANTAGLVSTWVDHSGNFNNASQTDPTALPLLHANAVNQLPALQFDGVNDFLEIPHVATLGITGDITTLWVVKFDDFATYRTVWAKTASNQPRPNDYYLLPNTGIPRLLRSSAAGGSADGLEAPPAGTFITGGYEVTGTTAVHYLDGRDIGGGEITAGVFVAPFSLRLGTRGDFVTKMKGEIAEILIYSAALSDTDRSKVTDYLKTKYFTQVPRFTGIRRQANGVVLEWSATATLEEASQIAGPWTPVANAVSPFSGTITVQQKYYRLRQ